MPEQNPFKGRHFEAEMILWILRWYLRFPISYRELELMLADQGVAADHLRLPQVWSAPPRQAGAAMEEWPW